jgi:asparagine synthetase B (glutamine-hydrolysing)
LLNRGPDYLGQATRTVPTDAQVADVSLTFTSTVLALRGDHVAKQPFEDPESSSVLCWNGEAWKIDGQPVGGNDGEAIFARLTSNPGAGTHDRQSYILQVLRGIQGPFAFLFYPGKCLYFGRDRLGRRSLLVSKSESADVVAFSSVADSLSPDWKEVAADGVYSMPLGTCNIADLVASKHDWISSGGADLVSARCSSQSSYQDDAHLSRYQALVDST